MLLRIGALVRASALTLARDPLALASTFLLPLVLFSIFAAVFGGLDGQRSQQVAVSFVVEDESEPARSFVELLAGSDRLRGRPAGARHEAESLVRSGTTSAAVIVPPGFGERLARHAEGRATPDGSVVEATREADVAGARRRSVAGQSGDDGTRPAEVLLLADVSDPLATQVVEGVLRAAALELGLETLASEAGLLEEGESVDVASALRVETVDLLGDGGRKRPSIAYFAAGLGVMFLLFSLSARSGLLIDEREAGVLLRARAAGAGLGEILLAHGLFLTGLGLLQVTAMFCWGALAFDLDLFTPRHLAGFFVLTPATAAAAAAFALVLAAASRTRAQLAGITAASVLVLSALGGSMFPRFLMPEALQRVGRLTFNAWALDGYQAVFWYESPPLAVLPHAAMLLAAALVLGLIARMLASRWSVRP